MKIHIEGQVRTATEKEIAEIEKLQSDARKLLEAQAQADADRQALKIATLAKLGLTADEVAALLS